MTQIIPVPAAAAATAVSGLLLLRIAAGLALSRMGDPGDGDCA